MKLALSLLTCDKPELVAQSCKPLIEAATANRLHLFVVDGSTNPNNEKLIWEMTWPAGHMHANIRGGAGAAIVYALTMMLQHEENYSHVALCESDVLLHSGWLDCLDLFERGRAEGLEVGAVSARCFIDRVLIQKDNFAITHNTGAGMIVLTRAAAKIVLDTFRTPWTSDNRRVFSQLCGIDIAAFWAFRANEHYLTADWHWDAALAAHGLASLARTPSPVEMIGQNPPLAEQGLEIATGPVEERRDDKAFGWYRGELAKIREGYLQLGVETKFHFDVANATWTHFPHQMAMLGGTYVGDWHLKEVRGFGTFGWVSGQTPDSETGPQHTNEMPSLVVPIFGSCAVLVSGGKTGGKVEVLDEQSGFKATPDLPPEGEQGQVLQLMVPGNLNARNIRITALTPGICFYGVQTREKQPFLPAVSFSYQSLPLP
jgi:hypothetical protein